jgi:hypothetical protein
MRISTVVGDKVGELDEAQHGSGLRKHRAWWKASSTSCSSSAACACATKNGNQSTEHGVTFQMSVA